LKSIKATKDAAKLAADFGIEDGAIYTNGDTAHLLDNRLRECLTHIEI